jgi:protein-tyrosine phosphatase
MIRPYLQKIWGFADFLQMTQSAAQPNPYFGIERGFEHVMNLIEEASDGFMKFAHQKVHA